MAVPVVTDLADMYRLADTGAVVSLFSRLGKINRTCELKF
jgi:protein transport protein SEC24